MDQRYNITSRHPRRQPPHQEHNRDPSHDARSRASHPFYNIHQLHMMRTNNINGQRRVMQCVENNVCTPPPHQLHGSIRNLDDAVDRSTRRELWPAKSLRPKRVEVPSTNGPLARQHAALEPALPSNDAASLSHRIKKLRGASSSGGRRPPGRGSGPGARMVCSGAIRYATSYG